jgi:hypothetical protein
MKIKILTAREAINEIGLAQFLSDIDIMSKETYNLWFKDYYLQHLEDFPSYKTLSEYHLDFAMDNKKSKFYKNFVKSFCIINDDNNNNDNNNNKIIGLINITINDGFDIYKEEEKNKKSYWMTDLFIFPEWRCKGIGSLLINYAMDYSKKNLPNLHLACYENLIAFYEKKGWIILSKDKDDILDTTPWTIMKLF